MHSIINLSLRVAALVGGTALIGSQIIQNLEYLGWANAPMGLGLAAVAVPFSMAVAVIVMEHHSRQRRYAGAGVTLVVLLLGLGHTFVVALERSALARDQQAAAKSSHGYDRALTAYTEANARLDVREAEEAVPCARVGKDRKPTRACVAARDNTANARIRADALRADLAQFRAPVETSGMARRYGSLATVIDIWHPVLLLLAVELGALVLIGFAFHREEEKPDRPPVTGANTAAAPAKEAEAEGFARVMGGQPVRSAGIGVANISAPGSGTVIARFRPPP